MLPYCALNVVITALAADAIHHGIASIPQVLQLRYLGAFLCLGVYLLSRRKRLLFTEAGFRFIVARSAAGLAQSASYYSIASVAGVLAASAGKSTFPLWVSAAALIQGTIDKKRLILPMALGTAGVAVFAAGMNPLLFLIGISVGFFSSLITASQKQLGRLNEPSVSTVFWQTLFTFVMLSLFLAMFPAMQIPFHLRVAFLSQGLIFALSQLLYDIANTKGNPVLSSYLAYSNLAFSAAADVYFHNAIATSTLLAMPIFIASAFAARRAE